MGAHQLGVFDPVAAAEADTHDKHTGDKRDLRPPPKGKRVNIFHVLGGHVHPYLVLTTTESRA